MIWKHQKYITSKQKKKNLNFFKSAFEKHSQTGTRSRIGLSIQKTIQLISKILFYYISITDNIWDCDSGYFLKCFSFENVLK
jgi:hypothetical protein